MADVKRIVTLLLQTLPDDCSLEDIQHELTLMARIRNGLERAKAEQPEPWSSIELPPPSYSLQ